MKKIMGAVLAAAMLAGTVTAADVSFSYKGANYFGPSNFTHLGRTDCLSVSLVTEAGGVVVDFDTTGAEGNSSFKSTNYGKYSQPRYSGAAIDASGADVDLFDDKIPGVGFVADEYYGWMNFALPLGQLQVTAGRWNGRNVNRVLADRRDLEGKDFELFKPGVINGTVGADSANLTNGNLGMVAAWTLADVLPGTLMVKVGLAHYGNSSWNANGGYKYATTGKTIDDYGYTDYTPGNWTWNPDYNTFAVKAGPLAELSYRQEGAFAANLAVRSLNKHSYSFGAWISPELADTVQMTIGGTVATGKLWLVDTSIDGSGVTKGDGSDLNKGKMSAAGAWSDRHTEWGIDFRLRLQVTDDLSITTMNNISSGIDPLDGKSNGVLWNMLNATYQIADNLTTAFTLQSIADLFCPATKRSNEWTLIMSPSLVIQASERARVTTSVRAQMNNTERWTFNNMDVVVPVIFSFNY